MAGPRAGWGGRHPAIGAWLDAGGDGGSLAFGEGTWANGTIPLRTSAHPFAALDGVVPDPLVVSVRCLVRVGSSLVLCTNADGLSHPWPGGRREPGETFADTARREVHEETGWIVEPASLRPLGWLHLMHLSPMADDWPFPHPDFFQIVLTGVAVERDGDASVAWTDTQGYELSSCLVELDEALARTEYDEPAAAFVRMLR